MGVSVCVLGWSLVFFGVYFPTTVSLRRVPSFIQPRKVLAIEYEENCDGKTYPYMHSNFTFIRHGAYTLISAVGVASRDFYGPLPGELRIIKCEDRSDRSTCKLYTSFKWQDACELDKLIPLLKTFVDQVQPPLTCPVKKGEYHMRNVKMPTDTIAALLPPNSRNKVLWIIRFILKEGHQTFACHESGFRIADARTRP